MKEIKEMEHQIGDLLLASAINLGQIVEISDTIAAERRYAVYWFGLGRVAKYYDDEEIKTYKSRLSEYRGVEE